MKCVNRLDPDSDWGEISILLTDNSGITALNEKFLRRRDSTDVLSFRYEPLPRDTAPCDGEIIVNIDRVVEEGPSHGGESKELALYLAHGCDHLAGQEDRTEDEMARMRQRELGWLEEAGSLAEDLVGPAE